MVAATKTRATATGERVAPRTRKTTAIWFVRSPKRLMSWPTHRALNEPLSASRTYGCLRARAAIRAATLGTGGAGTRRKAGADDGEAIPAPAEPSRSGRSSVDAWARPGASPVDHGRLQP